MTAQVWTQVTLVVETASSHSPVLPSLSPSLMTIPSPRGAIAPYAPSAMDPTSSVSSLVGGDPLGQRRIPSRSLPLSSRPSYR